MRKNISNAESKRKTAPIKQGIPHHYTPLVSSGKPFFCRWLQSNAAARSALSGAQWAAEATKTSETGELVFKKETVQGFKPQKLITQ